MTVGEHLTLCTSEGEAEWLGDFAVSTGKQEINLPTLS